jgi:hypothetical protein
MSLARQRGSALLIVMGVLAAMALMAVGVLAYASQGRSRAVRASRKVDRYSCSESGLQLARAFYGNNYANWNTYLADPTHYNASSPALATGPAALYVDLDSDGAPDVYLYIRDNADELPPAVDNPARDNDQAVIVGARCISPTLEPRRDDGTVDPAALVSEGLLQYNVSGATYTAQATGGASGNGNQNHGP